MSAKDKGEVGLALLHGSELGAWIWDDVVPLLRHPALAVDLPGRGSRPADRRTLTLRDAVDSVAEDIDRWAVPHVVVVAHSFSGVLVPAITAAADARVVAAVMVGASVPQAGKAWVDRLPASQRLPLRLMYKVRPAGMLSPARQNRKTLCNDLDEGTTTEFLQRRVPEAPHLLLDPVPTAELPPRVPWHFVRLLGDRSISPTARDTMLAELPEPAVHDLATGHLPMLSHRQQLADLLDTIAEESAPG